MKIDPKRERQVLAKLEVQKLFKLWYCHKQGILAPGMLVHEDGMVYKVLDCREEIYGWFIVTPCTIEGKPLSKLNTVLSYYHERSAEFGQEITSGNMLAAMRGEIVQFIRENPEARVLLQQAGILPEGS